MKPFSVSIPSEAELCCARIAVASREGNSSQFVAFGGVDKTVSLHTFGDATRRARFTGHTSSITAIALDQAATRVAAASDGGGIRVWDVQTEESIRTFTGTGHRARINSIDYHSFGEFIVTGSEDTTVRVWDVRKKACIQSYKNSPVAINVVRCSPDGRCVVSGCVGGIVRVYDLAAGKAVQEIVHHQRAITSIFFHPEAVILGVTSEDCTASAWEMTTFAEMFTLPPGDRPINCGAFSENYFLAASDGCFSLFPYKPMAGGLKEDALKVVAAPWLRAADLCFDEQTQEALVVDWAGPEKGAPPEWKLRATRLAVAASSKGGGALPKVGQGPSSAPTRGSALPPAVGGGGGGGPSLGAAAAKATAFVTSSPRNGGAGHPSTAMDAAKHLLQLQQQQLRAMMGGDDGNYARPAPPSSGGGDAAAPGAGAGGGGGMAVPLKDASAARLRDLRLAKRAQQQQLQHPPQSGAEAEAVPPPPLERVASCPAVGAKASPTRAGMGGVASPAAAAAGGSGANKAVPLVSPTFDGTPVPARHGGGPATAAAAPPPRPAAASVPMGSPPPVAPGRPAVGTAAAPAATSAAASGLPSNNNSGRDERALVGDLGSTSGLMKALLQRRLTHAKVVRTMWNQDPRGALGRLQQLATDGTEDSVSIVVDFLIAMQNLRMKEKIVLETLPMVLQLCVHVLDRQRHEAAVLAAISVARSMNNKFRSRIDEGLRGAALAGAGIDLAMEARIEKCTAAQKAFDAVHEFVSQYVARKDAVGEEARLLSSELPPLARR